MSYSLSVQAENKDGALSNALAKAFEQFYPEPAEQVTEHVDAALQLVENFETFSAKDEGRFNISLYGHAQGQFENDQVRSTLNLQISPV